LLEVLLLFLPVSDRCFNTQLGERNERGDGESGRKEGSRGGGGFVASAATVDGLARCAEAEGGLIAWLGELFDARKDEGELVSGREDGGRAPGRGE
jgi:hypothetical protein